MLAHLSTDPSNLRLYDSMSVHVGIRNLAKIWKLSEIKIESRDSLYNGADRAAEAETAGTLPGTGGTCWTVTLGA